MPESRSHLNHITRRRIQLPLFRYGRLVSMNIEIIFGIKGKLRAKISSQRVIQIHSPSFLYLVLEVVQFIQILGCRTYCHTQCGQPYFP